jgi:GGDEF domain-containing protein
MTVNVTCTVCAGAPACTGCIAATMLLSSAGHATHHTSRYSALRAAAAGSSGFDAFIVPIGSNERAVADATLHVLADKRVALVLDDAARPPIALPPHFAILRRSRFDQGAFSLDWLTSPVPSPPPSDATRASAPSIGADDDDRIRATRRIHAFATAQRQELAMHDGPSAGLDMLAVLEDEVHWWRASGSGFGIVLLHIGGLLENAADDDVREASVEAVFAALRSVARQGDTLARQREDYLIVLPEADGDGTMNVARRAVAALSVAHEGLPPRPRRAKGLAAWSAGVASCPSDGSSSEALIARASATLRPIDQWMRER